ncbi:putative defense protein 3 [Mercenaria mercenaria]|uniref:putative defense protein 3 n=1 Tax=Mercenaria mercenaria TaxID=6596 RepID=UPI00234EB9ED|nr:putative defense protein 3 [Mercenaria mercenaria]
MYAPYMFLLLVLLTCCEGYRLGPPLSACSNMKPIGHPYDPQNITSPFTFTLNASTYQPGDVIEVFLNSSGEWFMEGVLIQARASDCALQEPAVGTFSVQTDDIFLEPFNCFGRSASAIRHYSHYHIYNRTFYWTAPSQSVGDVYLKATVARNQEKYWLNVMSDTILDVSDNKRETCGATNTAVTVVTLLMTLAFTFILN